MGSSHRTGTGGALAVISARVVSSALGLAGNCGVSLGEMHQRRMATTTTTTHASNAPTMATTTPADNEPATGTVSAVGPVEVQELPAGHGVQDVAEPAAEKDPAAHATCAVAEQ